MLVYVYISDPVERESWDFPANLITFGSSVFVYVCATAKLIVGESYREYAESVNYI